MTLYCNIASLWLCTCTEWSLLWVVSFVFMPIGKWCNLATGCNLAIDCHHWSYSKFMYYSLNLWSTLDFNFIVFIINVLSLRFAKCPTFYALRGHSALSPLAGNLGRTLPVKQSRYSWLSGGFQLQLQNSLFDIIKDKYNCITTIHDLFRIQT